MKIQIISWLIALLVYGADVSSSRKIDGTLEIKNRTIEVIVAAKNKMDGLRMKLGLMVNDHTNTINEYNKKKLNESNIMLDKTIEKVESIDISKCIDESVAAYENILALKRRGIKCLDEQRKIHEEKIKTYSRLIDEHLERLNLIQEDELLCGSNENEVMIVSNDCINQAINPQLRVILKSAWDLKKNIDDANAGIENFQKNIPIECTIDNIVYTYYTSDFKKCVREKLKGEKSN